MQPDGYVLNANDCDDGDFYTNPGNLGIINIDVEPNEPMDDFEIGRNYITMNPSCFEYDSYSLLLDAKDENKVFNIHRYIQASELISSAYWFFG